MLFNKMSHEDWCGPAFPLAGALDAHLEKGSLRQSDLESVDFHDAVTAWAQKYDATLIDRWEGFQALAQLMVTDDATWLGKAITALDNCLCQDPQETSPCPDSYDAVLDWLESKGDAGRRITSELRQRPWTAGDYIACDFLWQRYGGGRSNGRPDGPPILGTESTPILVASSIPGLKDHDAVLDLVVELLPGPSGARPLVTPDLWSMGMIAFRKEEPSEASTAKEDQRSFLRVMHDAFRLAWGMAGRLRWRLKARSGRFPKAISGRSAEVAAVCAARALASQGADNPGPLLDPGVAITACLGQPSHMLERRSVQPVSSKTIVAKLNAALAAGLAAVLVADGQFSPSRERHTSQPDRKDAPSLIIQTVSDLDQAYDSLLITSRAVAAYKAKIVKEWTDKWDEQPTPTEFTHEARPSGG
jgi:hypothetical protein